MKLATMIFGVLLMTSPSCMPDKIPPPEYAQWLKPPREGFTLSIPGSTEDTTIEVIRMSEKGELWIDPRITPEQAIRVWISLYVGYQVGLEDAVKKGHK